MRPQRITSTNNQVVKDLVRLKRKRGRYRRRLFLAEGEDLLAAALAAGISPQAAFVDQGAESDLTRRLLPDGLIPGRPEPEIYLVDAEVMSRISGLGSGTRVISVFAFVDRRLPSRAPAARAGGPFLFISGAGDPGNVGTLVRAAAAFGAAGVILGPQTADPFSPKALRATMGAIFQVPLYLGVAPDELVSWAERQNLAIISADAHRGKPVSEADLTGAFVLTVGAEREGAPEQLLTAGQIVTIPQAAEVESINLAMAGSVILYEAQRQRRRRESGSE